MKKIPTLFKRYFENGKRIGITPEVTPGMEWVLNGDGVATVKIDGACCAIIGGELYKRYDAKKGKQPPKDAIPCCDPDPITGHWPHWVKVNPDNPADKWFYEAFKNTYISYHGLDRTFEAVGPHFNANPYNLERDILETHAQIKIDVERSFEGIKKYLAEHRDEGIVFWKDGEPQCKIKRTDFGLPWPIREEN
jgi:hypothetical protein